MRNVVASIFVLFAVACSAHAVTSPLTGLPSSPSAKPPTKAQVDAFFVDINKGRTEGCIAVGFMGTLPKSVKTKEQMEQYCGCYTEEFWKLIPFSERQKLMTLGSEQYDYNKYERQRSMAAHSTCSKRAGDL